MAYSGAQGYARISSDSCIYKRRQVPSDDMDPHFAIVGLDERDIDTDEDREHGKMCSPLYRVARGGDDSDATDEGPSPARISHKVPSKRRELSKRSELQRYKLTRELSTTWTVSPSVDLFCSKTPNSFLSLVSGDSRVRFHFSSVNKTTHGFHASKAPPRVLCVTRRHLRKGKYVDFLGEYHLDLIQENGGAAIMIPRTALTVPALAEYLPMDGLLVVEGNDISDEVLNKYGRGPSAPCGVWCSLNPMHQTRSVGVSRRLSTEDALLQTDWTERMP